MELVHIEDLAQEVASATADVSGALSTEDIASLGFGARGPAAQGGDPRHWELHVTICMAKFILGTSIDLNALVTAIPNTTYIPEVSRFATIRSIRQPRYVAVISNTGIVLLFTSCDADPARLAAKRAARLVKRLYSASACFRQYEVRNLIASSNLGCRIDIEGFGKSINDSATQAQSPWHLRELSARRALVDVTLESSEGVSISGGSRNSATQLTQRGTRPRQAQVKVHASGQVSVFQCTSLREANAVVELLSATLRAHRKWW